MRLKNPKIIYFTLAPKMLKNSKISQVRIHEKLPKLASFEILENYSKLVDFSRKNYTYGPSIDAQIKDLSNDGKKNHVGCGKM